MVKQCFGSGTRLADLACALFGGRITTRAADPAPGEGETPSQPEVIKPERKEKDKD